VSEGAQTQPVYISSHDCKQILCGFFQQSCGKPCDDGGFIE